MRMLLQVRIPHQAFNEAVRNGTAGQKLEAGRTRDPRQEVIVTTLA
jgi:hypothetical protein